MNMEKMRTWVEVDTKACVYNLQVARELTGKPVMPVIKGNAHGHGAEKIGLELERNGAEAFAVACLTEAVSLRKSGIKVPVLILGYTPEECAEELVSYDITQSILDEDYAIGLSENACKTGKTIQVHVKLDTGMTRTGISAQEDPESAADAILRISRLPGLRITGIFSHYAVADVPEKDDYTAWQLSNYKKVLEALSQKGFTDPVVHHFSNSAVILNHPESYFDMVRMGVMMYGFYPDGVYRENGPLKEALSLKTRVAQVREVPAGTRISYGCTYETNHPSRIAAVAAGYADAYPRSLSNKGAYAVINGHRCPQVGRICMDMCMFDVTGVDVKRGDEVILYGKGGIPLDIVAGLAGSINCEPTCLLTERIEKVFI